MKTIEFHFTPNDALKYEKRKFDALHQIQSVREHLFFDTFLVPDEARPIIQNRIRELYDILKSCETLINKF